MGWRGQHNRDVDREAEERARFAALPFRMRIAVWLERLAYALLLVVVVALIAFKVLAAPATAQPYDDEALLRQLAFVAGPAVICKLAPAETASEVMRRIADGMGYDEADKRDLLDHSYRNSQVGGCRLADTAEFETLWARMMIQAGVEP